jgi:hypothetical protein
MAVFHKRKREQLVIPQDRPYHECLPLDVWFIILRHVDPLDLIAMRCTCRSWRRLEGSDMVTAIWVSYMPRIQLLCKYIDRHRITMVTSRSRWSKLVNEFREPEKHYTPITFPWIPEDSPYGENIRNAREYYEYLWFQKSLHHSHISWSVSFPRDPRGCVDVAAQLHIYSLYATLRLPTGRTERIIPRTVG